MKKRDAYMAEIEAQRTPAGLPSGWNDYISVHRNFAGDYSLLSPMCIVERMPRMARPTWEKERFARKADAVKRGRELVRYWKGLGERVFLVDCTDPLTG